MTALTMAARRVIQQAARHLSRTGPIAVCTRCGLHRVDVVVLDGQPAEGVLTGCTPWCEQCWDRYATKDGVWVTALPGTVYGLAAQSLSVLVTGMVERGRYAGPEEAS